MAAIGEGLANTLEGLARADVTVLGPDASIVASTLEPAMAAELGRAASAGEGVAQSDEVDAVFLGDQEYWVTRGELPGAGAVLFSRSVADELAALPGIRQSYAFAGLIALAFALGLGAVFALVIVRPVRALAVAADRVTEADFDAPVPGSRVEEVERLGTAFRSMRAALRRRLTELAEANEALEERQQKLTALQAELIRQDRLASSARMVAELAHEIRNPVANVRNCLEVVRRRVADDAEGTRFADMAIDELLRMHELAEGLLDLHRPAIDPDGTCDAGEVAGQVAALARVGGHPVSVRVDSSGEGMPLAAIPSDALKQILLNLVLNAGEAGEGDATVDIAVSRRNGSVLIDVFDDGPGLADDVIDRLFDPFFTTKGGVTGVGLGLFVAEGLARRYGGRLEGVNRRDRSGAHFRIEIPVSERREDHDATAEEAT
jgi:signal transduction histidine kinase